MSDIITSINKYSNLAAESPLPAWIFAVGLGHTAYAIPWKMPSSVGSSGGSYLFHQSEVFKKPSRNTCILFGLTHALGGYMVYDGDETNGAGFTFAWSTLYLIVNGRSSFKSLIKGRVTPVSLSFLALGNASIYGKGFFWPQ